MPYPEYTSNHFIIDPTRFDFYAMDCYRHVAEDKMVSTLAEEIIPHQHRLRRHRARTHASVRDR